MNHFLKKNFIYLTITCLVIACCKSQVVTHKAAPNPQMEARSEAVNAKIFIDATLSMEGFVLPGSSTDYARTIPVLEGAIEGGWAMLAAVLVWNGCGGSSEAPKTETPPAETPAAETPAPETPAPIDAAAVPEVAKSPATASGDAGTASGGAKQKPAANQMASGETGAGAKAEKTVLVAAGSAIKGKLEGPLNSKTNKTGDVFRLIVAEPILVDNMEVIPKGTVINGTVTAVKPAESGKKASMSLAFESVTLISGKTVGLDASSSVEGADATVQGESKTGRNAAVVAGAAAAGALAGKLLGKGNAETAVGAVGGAAVGAAATAFLKGGDVDLKAGPPLSLKLNKELAVPVRAASGSNVAGQ